jgi:hypothetical protein
LDYAASAGAALRYIEGTVAESNGVFSFTNITYGGDLGASEGSGPITGTINGTEINYVFTNFQGYNESTDGTNGKQWFKTPGATLWQPFSEYDAGGAAIKTVEKRSSIIYLVLDASTSLNSTNISLIRNAAKAFIETVYSQTGSGISSISYSPVNYYSWPLQSDGRYQSYSIGDGETTKMRVYFTSTRANALLRIKLDVSSESGQDWAFVGNLDDTSASTSSYYGRISGVNSRIITIPVPSAGSHYVDIGYGKDSTNSAGPDCAWFKIVE